MDRDSQAKAIASDVRRTLLTLLQEPNEHFAHQVTGDPDAIGVCVTLLTEHVELSQPTVSRHLDLLRRAGFVDVTRIGRWSYYSRNQDRIDEFARWLGQNL